MFCSAVDLDCMDKFPVKDTEPGDVIILETCAGILLDLELERSNASGDSTCDEAGE